MGIAEEDRSAYDTAPQLHVVGNSPRFAMLWESVLFDPDLTSNAKVIYAVLQRMAHEERGTFAPSKNDIGQRAGVKDRGTILACLKSLEERGYIRLESRGQWETDVIILVDPSEFSAGKTRTLREKPAEKPLREIPAPCGKNQHPLREKPAPPAGISRTLTDTKRQREITTADAVAEATPLTPFLAFTALCEKAHLDPDGFTEKERKKIMGVAKRLILDGLTEPDLRGVTHWLFTQPWRSQPVSIFDVERKVGEWRAAGRPTAHVQAQARPAYRNQADFNAAGQRDENGNLIPVA